MGSHSHCALAGAGNAGIIAQDCLDFDPCPLVASDCGLRSDATFSYYAVKALYLTVQTGATGFDRSFWRPTDAMPGYSMQLVKKRREKTIANNNELALAA